MSVDTCVSMKNDRELAVILASVFLVQANTIFNSPPVPGFFNHFIDLFSVEEKSKIYHDFSL
jgi:hypothetical protein